MKKTTIVTHNGSFHADDCFAVAALLILLDDEPVEVVVVRTRDEEAIKSADFVVDVGNVHDPIKNRFDHHQFGGAGERINGIPYAAVGLVWQKYGSEISRSEKVANFVDESLIQTLDANDNGIDISKPISDNNPKCYLVSDVIASYVPTWRDEEKCDELFTEAVAFAKNLLIREIKNAEQSIKDDELVEMAYNTSLDKRIIVLEKDYDWERFISTRPEPLIVVFPKNDVFYAKAVKKGLVRFETRIKFPESWAGKRDKELADISGVSDAIFCPNQRFMVVAKSKEAAIQLAVNALK